MSEIPYIGHVISPEGVKPDPNKVAAIKDMKEPQNSDEIKRFLGHINYLAKFIPNLSAESEPLRRLVNASSSQFVWSRDQQQSFQKLKQLISSEAVLRYFNPNEPIIIQTDASTVGIGAVLIQAGKPVAYASRSLTDSEQHYAPIELECLAIVFGLTKFDQYVFGHQDIKIHTDHQPLVSIMKKSLLKAPRRLQSMIMALQRYCFEVQYRPGSEQVTADMLSRSPIMTSQDHVGDNNQIFQIMYQENHGLFDIDPKQDCKVTDARYKSIQQATLVDSTLSQLMKTILSGWPQSIAEVHPVIQHYWTFRDELAVLDGIIYKGIKIIIPEILRRETLERLHASHQGAAATIRRARQVVYWPNMAQDIEIHTQQCVTCQLDSPQQQKETIRHHQIPDQVWSKVGMDLFSYDSKDYLIIVDYLSDFFEVEPLTSITSSTVIEACKRTFARYGIPHVVHSDNGRQFDSAEFRTFSANWGFIHSTSSPYHSQSNGKAEAAVKIAKRIFRRTEDPYLALLEVRNTPTQGMSTAPVQRLLGRETRSIFPQVQWKDLRNQTILQEKQAKKIVMQTQYNTSAKDLPTLVEGTPVLNKDFTSRKNNWQRGTIVDCLSERSYSVANNEGNILRRNRVDIRPFDVNKEIFSDHTRDKLVTAANNEPKPTEPRFASNKNTPTTNTSNIIRVDKSLQGDSLTKELDNRESGQCQTDSLISESPKPFDRNQGVVSQSVMSPRNLTKTLEDTSSLSRRDYSRKSKDPVDLATPLKRKQEYTTASGRTIRLPARYAD